MSKYYKLNEEIFAFADDGSEDAFIPAGAAPMSASEVDAALNPPKSEAELTAEARAAFKAQREIAVANIKVTSSLGRTFDGDEVSTTRMLKAIAGLDGEPEDTATLWLLADNTPAMVGRAEFIEVLRLAGIEQTRLWVPADPEPEVVAAEEGAADAEV